LNLNLKLKTFKANKKIDFTVFFILALTLLAKSFVGVDLTDEMQYYGQIISLVNNNSLFINDLFIQQTVYLLFYPIFKIFINFFGDTNLIFFSRIFLSIIILILYVYSYKKLLIEFPKYISSLVSFALCLSVAYSGIFGISYNTVAQIFWIIFTLNFYNWSNRNIILLSFLIILVFFSHPISAFAFSLLVLSRLIAERKINESIHLIKLLIFFGTLSLCYLLYFADLNKYLSSIIFSKGFGVGKFFTQYIQYIFFLLFCLMFPAINYLHQKKIFLNLFKIINFPSLIIIYILCGLLLSCINFFETAYSAKLVIYLTLLIGIVYVYILFNSRKSKNSNFLWLIILLLTYIASLGMTSANGMTLTSGSLFVILPIFFAVAFTNDLNTNYCKKKICLLLLCCFYLFQSINYPYRDNIKWNNLAQINNFPMLNFIFTSKERVIFLDKLRDTLIPFTDGKKTLILSEYPVLYLGLDVIPETCMLYMHSIQSINSKNILSSCLLNKNPELLIDIYSEDNISKRDSLIKSLTKNIYKDKVNKCENIKFHYQIQDNKKRHMDISVCSLDS
jgi:hypothetical protein